MSTKAQRKLKRIAAKHGKQFALERSVLNAARSLRGAIMNHGLTGIPSTTWHQFMKAEDALHDFHVERQRKSK